MRAIILSAGQGQRLLPLTARIPKCLLPVHDEQPVLEVQLRALAQEIIQTLGGKKIHQVTSIPGGVSIGLSEGNRDKFQAYAEYFVEFGKFTFQVFEDIVLKNSAYVDLILSDTYTQKT